MTEAGTDSSARIAIIGVSHWHLPLYLPGFAEADVVGVWDRLPARAGHLARSIGATRYDSRAALLDQDIHLAFVFGDPWEMLDPSMECLRRRIPISVEKPAAPSSPQIDELVSESERAGVKAFAHRHVRASSWEKCAASTVRASRPPAPAPRRVARGMRREDGINTSCSPGGLSCRGMVRSGQV